VLGARPLRALVWSSLAALANKGPMRAARWRPKMIRPPSLRPASSAQVHLSIHYKSPPPLCSHTRAPPERSMALLSQVGGHFGERPPGADRLQIPALWAPNVVRSRAKSGLVDASDKCSFGASMNRLAQTKSSGQQQTDTSARSNWNGNGRGNGNGNRNGSGNGNAGGTTATQRESMMP